MSQWISVNSRKTPEEAVNTTWQMNLLPEGGKVDGDVEVKD